MPRNGSGTYSLPAGNPVVTGTVISSTVQNNTMSDVATALTNSLAKDGQTTPTANLPMGGFKLTNLGTGNSRTDSANLGQIQDEGYIWLASVAGTNTITASTSPATTAYTAGQTYRFTAAGANTGAVTININSLGAKSITKNGATALISGDIPSGAVCEITYDGTQFQLINIGNATIGADSISAYNLADSSLGAAMVNGTITATVNANALTIAIKTKAGTDPSSVDPVLVYFRNATAGTGDYTVISITAATSLVLSSGSTLGTSNGVLARLWVVGFNDAGTFRIGAINLSTPVSIGDDVLASSTAEGGAGTADSAGIYYTATAVASKPMRVLSYIETTQATAGTWVTDPSKIQLISNIYDTKPPANSSTINIGTSIASTSGTSIDFTGLPTWTRRVIINMSGLSTNGTSNIMVQIGDSGGIETTGYLGCVSNVSGSAAFTTGFGVEVSTAAANIYHGMVILTLLDSATATWVASASGSLSNVANVHIGSGSKPLSPGPLDRVRITTVAGTDTFDAGLINIMWE